MKDQNVFFARLEYWRTEITSFSSAILVFACGTICKLNGKIVMIWWKLLIMLGRISTSLSLGRWFSRPGGIFGRSGMIELSGTSNHLSGHGGMGSFMILLCSLIGSNGNTGKPFLSGLTFFLLEESCCCFCFLCNY